MKKQKIDVVTTEDGDWSGLFIDGKLVLENHAIYLDEFAEHVGIEVGFHQVEGELDEFGNQFPEELEKLKLDTYER